ncbi:P-loop containing nucleoside triphosphate hydrolase protein [Lactarius hengduanensis]|nr:P-loop containing nucleoside triphosphate hydrolase protein [Lactarius hengduanensis]
MSLTAVLGAQWGDEGKGKLLTSCARFAGGNNAGHTIIAPIGPERVQTTFAFHLLPSGLVNTKVTGVIGPGVVVHVPSFFEEFDTLRKAGQHRASSLSTDDRTETLWHGLKEVELGGSSYVLRSLAQPRKASAPAYSAKASRSGLRIVEGRYKRYGHFEYDTEGEIERYKGLADRLRPFVIDSVVYIHEALATGKRILVEGANALMLDIDYGTYPYVTSSSTSVGGVCTGLGIPAAPHRKGHRGYQGIHDSCGGRTGTGVHLQEVGHEYGTTTGRRRRCGWLDLVVMKHSCLINGYDALNLTKLDVLDDLEEIRVAVGYVVDGKELPGFPETLGKVEVSYVTLPGWKTSIAAVSSYEDFPENCRKQPIEWIGVGPRRESMV